MIVVKCAQGSDEWNKLKLGVPSASNASKIIQSSGKPSKQREGYLYELAAERITGTNNEGYTNKNVEEGKERETESRAYYELIKNVEVEEVGVVYKDKKKKSLCSPDGLVKGKYGLEMKNPIPKTQVKYLLVKQVPTDYLAQIQFSLYVTGFKYWDYLSYCPNMPHLLIRVKRDETFIGALEKELHFFCRDLNEIVKKIKGG